MGLIRKIIIGPDPKDAMAYYVGMRAGPRNVTAIITDDEYLHRYSKPRYLIYVEGEEGTTLWKSVVDTPCVIEYDLNF